MALEIDVGVIPDISLDSGVPLDMTVDSFSLPEGLVVLDFFLSRETFSTCKNDKDCKTFCCGTTCEAIPISLFPVCMNVVCVACDFAEAYCDASTRRCELLWLG